MKAVYIELFASHDNIKVGEIPKPEVRDRGVGISVASGNIDKDSGFVMAKSYTFLGFFIH